MNCSAVILAGGESLRMGCDKAWLELDGKPLLVHAVQKVRQLGVAEVFLSGRAGTDYTGLKCPVLHDRYPGFGPLAGIERALQACATPLLLVLAVDLPRMTPAFLAKLLAHADALTGVVPRWHGRLEPLAALYPRRVHEIAFRHLAQGRRAVVEFAEACRRQQAVRTLRVSRADAACFTNWNSPVDAAAFRRQPGSVLRAAGRVPPARKP